mmetsp:Transcript_62048/g.174958  ORF Transcript_62048/g.174958 Transcript_62048/m.174958 type:complete len:452 (+) Transcript_62048:358-1713(+)
MYAFLVHIHVVLEEVPLLLEHRLGLRVRRLDLREHLLPRAALRALVPVAVLVYEVLENPVPLGRLLHGGAPVLLHELFLVFVEFLAEAVDPRAVLFPPCLPTSRPFGELFFALCHGFVGDLLLFLLMLLTGISTFAGMLVNDLLDLLLLLVPAPLREGHHGGVVAVPLDRLLHVLLPDLLRAGAALLLLGDDLLVSPEPALHLPHLLLQEFGPGLVLLRAPGLPGLLLAAALLAHEPLRPLLGVLEVLLELAPLRPGRLVEGLYLLLHLLVLRRLGVSRVLWLFPRRFRESLSHLLCLLARRRLLGLQLLDILGDVPLDVPPQLLPLPVDPRLPSLPEGLVQSPDCVAAAGRQQRLHIVVVKSTCRGLKVADQATPLSLSKLCPACFFAAARGRLDVLLRDARDFHRRPEAQPVELELMGRVGRVRVGSLGGRILGGHQEKQFIPRRTNQT